MSMRTRSMIFLLLGASGCGGSGLHEHAGKQANEALTPDTEYGYGFDPSGRTTLVTTGGAPRAIARSGNTADVGGVPYVYDAVGRLVQRGDAIFHYGPSDDIESAEAGGHTFQYVYDEKGERLQKSEDGVLQAAYLEEGYLDGAALTQPISYQGNLVGTLSKGVFHAAATDHGGTVQSNAGGGAELASPFGDRAAHPDVSPAVDYAQKGYDADLGLVRMGARDYDPAIGEFTSPDPLFLDDIGQAVKSPIESNLYGYARGNPVTFADPAGLEADASDEMSVNEPPACTNERPHIPANPIDRIERRGGGFDYFTAQVAWGPLSLSMQLTPNQYFLGYGGSAGTGAAGPLIDRMIHGKWSLSSLIPSVSVGAGRLIDTAPTTENVGGFLQGDSMTGGLGLGTPVGTFSAGVNVSTSGGAAWEVQYGFGRGWGVSGGGGASKTFDAPRFVGTYNNTPRMTPITVILRDGARFDAFALPNLPQSH